MSKSMVTGYYTVVPTLFKIVVINRLAIKIWKIKFMVETIIPIVRLTAWLEFPIENLLGHLELEEIYMSVNC